MKGNVIHHNLEKGINLHGARSCIIDGNEVYSNGWYGLYMGVENGGGDSNIIRNNLFYDNCTWDMDPTYIIRAPNNLFVNNTFVGHSTSLRALFDISGNGSDSTFKNNIFSHCGIIYDIKSGTISSDYNLFYTTGDTLIRWLDIYYKDLNSWQLDSGQDEYSLSQEPEFLNAANNDFHLQSYSPAIDAGIDVSDVVKKDFAGLWRCDGKGFDIGAYEYRGQNSPTQTYSEF